MTLLCAFWIGTSCSLRRRKSASLKQIRQSKAFMKPAWQRCRSVALIVRRGRIGCAGGLEHLSASLKPRSNLTVAATSICEAWILSGMAGTVCDSRAVPSSLRLMNMLNRDASLAGPRKIAGGPIYPVTYAIRATLFLAFYSAQGRDPARHPAGCRPKRYSNSQSKWPTRNAGYKGG